MGNLFISFENVRLFAKNYYLNIQLSKARRKMFSLKRDIRHLTSELYERISRYDLQEEEKLKEKLQPEVEVYILYLRGEERGVLKIKRWKTFPGKVKTKPIRKAKRTG